MAFWKKKWARLVGSWQTTTACSTRDGITETRQLRHDKSNAKLPLLVARYILVSKAAIVEP